MAYCFMQTLASNQCAEGGGKEHADLAELTLGLNLGFGRGGAGVCSACMHKH